LKATGEQEIILSPVAAASSSASPTGRGSGRWKSIPVPENRLRQAIDNALLLAAPTGQKEVS